ncbi:hypothetical protein ABH935_002937 [Catenulispora sp. GAS73]
MGFSLGGALRAAHLGCTGPELAVEAVKEDARDVI